MTIKINDQSQSKVIQDYPTWGNEGPDDEQIRRRAEIERQRQEAERQEFQKRMEQARLEQEAAAAREREAQAKAKARLDAFIKRAYDITQPVYQAVTPWRDERGETFIEFYKSKFSKKPDIYAPTKEELKEQEGKEQTAPLWQRLLSGPTVIKYKDEYIPVITGTAPAVGPGVVKSARPAINWDNVLKDVLTRKPNMAKAEIIKIADDTKSTQIFSQPKEITTPISTPGKISKELTKALKDTAKVSQISKSPKIGLAIIPTEWANMRANSTAKYSSDVAVPVTQQEAETLTRIGVRVITDPETGIKPYTNTEIQLSPAIKEFTRIEPTTETQPQTKTQLNFRTSTKTDTETKAPTAQKTTKPEPTPVPKPNPLNNPYRQPAPKAFKTPPRTSTVKIPDEDTTKKPVTKKGKVDKGKTQTFKLPELGNIQSADDKTKREAINKAEWVIARRRGTLDGKQLWLVTLPGLKKDIVLHGDAPEGARKAIGEGSLKNSVTLIRGNPPPRPIYRDTGAVDDIITPTKKGVIITSIKDQNARRR